MSDVAFTLNGVEISARPDETILQAAERHGVSIPHLCYTEGMRADGNCRACVVEITGERVAVLTDMAIKADDIDEMKAEEARKRAEARLAEKLTGEEQATVQASLMHSLAQLKVKRRQR